MTGSTLAPIVIAIAVSAGLAGWLVMVYYAASHPRWKHERRAAGQPLTGAGPAAGPGPAGREPGPLTPAGPSPRAGAGHAGGPRLPHAA